MACQNDISIMRDSGYISVICYISPESQSGEVPGSIPISVKCSKDLPSLLSFWSRISGTSCVVLTGVNGSSSTIRSLLFYVSKVGRCGVMSI